MPTATLSPSAITATAKRDKIVATKAKKKDEQIGTRVGKLLARYKLSKFVTWSDTAGKLQWTFDEAAIAAEQVFDGCYIIRADVPKELMAATELVCTYKSLSLVEQGFRNLKTVSLEMRPMYHQLDDRIRSHIFICFLAYYLQWQMTQRLKPLFASDGKGQARQWTIQNMLETLKGIQPTGPKSVRSRWKSTPNPIPSNQESLNY